MRRSTTIPALMVFSLGGLLGGAACCWMMDRGSPVAAAGSIQEVPAIKGWQKGKGWGWIWGKDDEVGALNGLTDAEPSRGADAGDEGRGLRPGTDVQPAELQVARAQPRRDHHVSQSRTASAG